MIDNSKVFVISAAVAVFSLIAVLIFMGVRISTLSGELDNNQTVYNGELDKNKQLIDEISQNLQIMSANSNEVRRSLNMPAKQLIQQKAEVVEGEDTDVVVSFFEAFRFLVQNEDLETSAAEFSRYIEENEIDEYFIKHEYDFERNDLLQAVVSKDNVLYLSLFYDGESKQIIFKDILDNSFELDSESSKLYTTLDKELVLFDSYFENIETMKESLDNLITEEEINTLLSDRKLVISKEEDSKYSIKLSGNNSVVGRFELLDDNFILNQDRYSDLSEFKASLISFLETVSNKTESELIDTLVLEKMETVFADEGFKVLLESNNCQTELTQREDDEFVYFDVLNPDNSVKGTFALQKEFGEVLLLSGDGKYLKSLNMFTADHDFKSLIINSDNNNESSPYVFDDSSENFLVVGTHEHNADTMIIVNANNKTGTLNMISVPRDLYYKGKKINNIYKTYGPERLCAELSEITGLDIKKYISIDMFAFIDVVNILGGLDVTLEEDLIDPTYKVKNNGVWSTLFYRKGTHHLDGVAALRVARSRHGSSDFDRSRRQQLVIKAIMNSMKSLDAGDMNKFYNFMTTISSYISTNLNIGDIVKNYLMYKDNDIADPNIINTDNILYATYTNIYLLSEDEQKTVLKNDDFYKGLWIVLPNDNDWNLIKKHIENILRIGI